MTTDLRLDPGVEQKGVLVVSDNDISVMVYVHGFKSGDAYMVDALTSEHMEFIVTSKQPYSRESAFVVVVATDNTQVTVHQKTSNNYVSQQTVTLNMFDTLTYMSTSDLTGYRIETDAPVAVQSGSVCDFVGGVGWCDHMCISVPPITNLGLNHYIAPVTVRPEPDAYVVRVVASEDGTDVTDLLTGSLVTTLQQGDYYDQEPTSSTSPAMALACSKPCLVAQYNKGRLVDMGTDPFLMSIPAKEYFITKAIFATPLYSESGTLVTQLVVVTMTEHTGGMVLNGVGLSSPWVSFEDGSGMMYTTMGLADGTYTLECTAPCGFHAWIYGLNSVDLNGHGTSLGYTGINTLYTGLIWRIYIAHDRLAIFATSWLKYTLVQFLVYI